MRQFQAAFMALILLGSGCSSDITTEDRIRAVIGLVEEAAEERSATEVSKHISVNYKDRYHASKRAVARALLGYFHQHRSIHLLTRVTTLEFEAGNRAAGAVVYVAMAGVPVESVEALVSVQANLYRFDIQLLEEEGAWKVNSATWRKATIADFR